MCLRGTITRPNNNPTKKINPTKDNIKSMKYFRDGDATTVSYKSERLSACGATCEEDKAINLLET